MTKILISGCRGRMGRVIAELCAADPELRVVAGIDPFPGDALAFPVYASPLEFTGDADCVIDFSSPKALDDLLRFAQMTKTPLVLATTGYTAEQIAQIDAASEHVPIFRSANMSVGINVLIELVKRAAVALPGFDIEIVERHHNQKLDAPSGTALMLADAAAEAVPYEAEYVYDRSQVRQKRDAREIGISAVRGGTIVGQHDVLFCGRDEVIELHHTSQSREVFAVGAVRAAKYLATVQTPGLYDMGAMLRNGG